MYYLSASPQVKVKVAQSCLTLCNPMDYTVHGMDSPGQNIQVDSLSLPQQIFPTHELNWALALQSNSLPTELSGKPCFSPRMLSKKRKKATVLALGCGALGSSWWQCQSSWTVASCFGPILCLVVCCCCCCFWLASLRRGKKWPNDLKIRNKLEKK